MMAGGRKVAWWSMGLTWGLAALAVSVVHAEEAADSKALAKEHNRTAIEAFKAKDYRAALENFERAFALNPDPKLRLNLALTNENLLRLDDARDHYLAYLAATPKDPKTAQVKEKLRALEERMQRHGRVVLNVEPVPQSIVFAGVRYTGSRNTVWIEPGKHKLIVEKEGFARDEREVDVRKGARLEVRVELRPVGETASAPVMASAEKKPLDKGEVAPAGKPLTDAATGPSAGTTPPGKEAKESRKGEGGGGPSPLKLVAGGLGAVGLGTGLLAVLVTMAGAGWAGLTYFTFTMIPGFARFQRPMQAAIIVGIASGILSVPAVLLGLVVGGVGVPAGIFVE